MNSRLAVIAVVLVLSTAAIAQDNPQEVFQHSRFEPHVSYPTIAKAAHVQGDVHLSVTLDKGHVTNVKVDSGHPMLAGAAADAFKDGWFASGVSGTFRVSFHFKLIGRETEDDWKKPEKVEWLLPDITVVGRALPPMVN